MTEQLQVPNLEFFSDAARNLEEFLGKVLDKLDELEDSIDELQQRLDYVG